MTSETNRLRRLRRDAEASGLILRKVPERSRWFGQYGPYMFLDPAHSHAIVVGSLQDLDAAEEWLRER